MLAVQLLLGFLFNKALIGSNDIPPFNALISCFFANDCSVNVFGMSHRCLADVLWTRVFQMDHSAISQPQCSCCSSDFRPRRSFPHLHFSMLLSHRPSIFPSKLLAPRSTWLHMPAAALANCLRNTSVCWCHALGLRPPHSSWHHFHPQICVSTCSHARLPEFFRLLDDTNPLRATLPCSFFCFPHYGLISDLYAQVFYGS